MTRWLNYLFNIGTVTTIKICPCHINLPNYVQNVSQCKIRPSKNSQILLKFCQSGEISPDLVTHDSRRNGKCLRLFVWESESPNLLSLNSPFANFPQENTLPCFLNCFSFHFLQFALENNFKIDNFFKKVYMVCLGFEPTAAGW